MTEATLTFDMTTPAGQTGERSLFGTSGIGSKPRRASARRAHIRAVPNSARRFCTAFASCARSSGKSSASYSCGTASSIAQRASTEVFAQIDADELLGAALDRRLRGRAIEGERERHRLYRYLVAQGFEPERVLDRLRKLPVSS